MKKTETFETNFTNTVKSTFKLFKKWSSELKQKKKYIIMLLFLEVNLTDTITATCTANSTTGGGSWVMDHKNPGTCQSK